MKTATAIQNQFVIVRKDNRKNSQTRTKHTGFDKEKLEAKCRSLNAYQRKQNMDHIIFCVASISVPTEIKDPPAKQTFTLPVTKFIGGVVCCQFCGLTMSSSTCSNCY